MRGLCLSVLLVVSPAWALAFEGAMLNLSVPSALEAKEGVLSIRHRFRGPIDEEPLGSFLGMDEGANVQVGLRYALRSGLEVNVSRTRFEKEYVLGASYAFSVPAISLWSQIDVQFFSFDRPPLTERRRNFLYLLTLQPDPVVDRITPVLNVGYDGYNERLGYGFGVDLGFEVDWGPISELNVIGEYYPVANRDEGITGPEDSFAAGLQLQTYGHQFAFLVCNSADVGPRRLMLGARTNDLHFGFNIKRLL